MKIKINKYIFDVSNKDWILDNGCCYQCTTLRHHSPTALMSMNYTTVTIMSKKQFKELVKQGILFDDTQNFRKKHPNAYSGCKIWRFNIGEEV